MHKPIRIITGKNNYIRANGGIRNKNGEIVVDEADIMENAEKDCFETINHTCIIPMMAQVY